MRRRLGQISRMTGCQVAALFVYIIYHISCIIYNNKSIYIYIYICTYVEEKTLFVDDPALRSQTPRAWGFPKLRVPCWGPYYKGILIFGVHIRGPSFP